MDGCGRDDVQVYQIAKEQPTRPTQTTMPPGHPDSSGGTPSLSWKLPTGWEEVPAGQMRVASFRVKGDDGKLADVSVIPLPGQAGSDLDNVNRWRGQVGLPPVSEQGLAKITQQVSIGSATGALYDQTGTNPASGEKTRVLAAVLRREGIAWFFKMSG